MVLEVNIRTGKRVEAQAGGRDTTPAKWRGEWQAEETYLTLQKVSREGSSYVCIKSCVGVDPAEDVGEGAEGTYWILIAKRGDDFTYDDFTPEQLEALKGKNGDSSKVTLEDVTSGGRTGVAVTVTNTSGDGNRTEFETKFIYNGTNGKNGTHGADSELQLERDEERGGLIVTVTNTVYPESGGTATTKTYSKFVADGKSAYAYAKEAGYTGTEEEFAKLLAGLETSSGGVSFTTDETLNLDPETGVLSVNTADKPEADNTLPITSAAVYATVGNIEALLATI